MAENSATILIPDISGFTEFMTTTELSHSSHAINILIDAILKAVDEEYEVSEIEGDAVLLIKKGAAPSQKQIVDTCLKIFNSFHVQRMWMQQHAICPCGACLGIINLTLKFVVHHGPVAEIKVGRFIKQSGPEMIVAHRLLKNSIANNEYLLITEKLLQQLPDEVEAVEMEWTDSSEEYASIGKIPYRFTLLNEARKKIPEPPKPNNQYHTDNTSFLKMTVADNFRDVYMVVMNIPGRPAWFPGLQNVEQDIPQVFIGSIHRCKFENYNTVVSPIRMTLTEEGIEYAESCRIAEMDISLVYEFVFKKINETTSSFACRLLNACDAPIPEKVHGALFDQMKKMSENLKEYCEQMKESFFEPSF
ncbi:MAG: DUF2652 domain-containing protein [Chitinophagaceae bacterium]